MPGCSAGRLAWFMVMFTTTGFILISTIPHVPSGFVIYLCFLWGLLLWMWLYKVPIEREVEREEHERREYRPTSPSPVGLSQNTQIVGFEFEPAQSSPTATMTHFIVESVSAPRAQYMQSALLPFGRSTQIARLAMRALPPVKNFTGDETTGSQCDCPICMEEFKNGEMIQPFGVCVHEFHSSCINSWLHSGKTTCPVCRKDLSTARSTQRDHLFENQCQ